MTRTGSTQVDTDVFIVGGGPAGLAAAIAASQRGLRVIVADGAKPPIAKACGEGLLPDAIKALAELGVALRLGDGCALRGIRFEDARASVSADFPGGHGIGMRRETLHRRMMERASECGVCLMWNTPVTALCEGGALAGGNKIRARWVIGADGGRSRVRKWSCLDNDRPRRKRYAFQHHYRLEPWTEFTEVHWGDTSQAYVTPVGPQEVCVVTISNTTSVRFDEALRGFPNLLCRLKSADLCGSERGAMTSMFRLKRVHRGNVALIGDASGSVDAITGEGLSLSFRQAMSLADALDLGDLRGYEKSHRRLARRPHFVGNLLLLLDRRDGFRKRTIRAFETAPMVFERLLAYHVGETHPLQLATAGVNFGWRFLTA